MSIRLNVRLRRWMPGLFLLLCCCGSAWAANPDAACTPRFPLQTGTRNGWLGADAAYSIPLPTGEDVWIFGDTLYGKGRVVHGNNPVMVHNTIGISTCAQGKWKIRYFIRKDAQGNPVSFFASQHPHTWYWALDGFRAGKDLWVTLLCVRQTDPASALGFGTCGTDLARIESPGANPLAWKIAYFPLVADGAHAYPSASAVVMGNAVDIFALDEKGSRPLIASRISLSGLAHPRENLEYLARDGRWRKGFDPANAQPVMSPGISELSIRYHPELKQWVAVMFDPQAFSSHILLRTAPSPTGPWSEGKVIYTVPEMVPGNPRYDKDNFCYAGKEHPEFEHGDLVFTYVCNTFAIPKMATEMDIYFPRAIRMPMPVSPAEGRAAEKP
ncbi:MAG: DUF4185 domain-containing protein [Acidobacteriaceae bacterium]